jgi:hypothetical protein
LLNFEKSPASRGFFSLSLAASQRKKGGKKNGVAMPQLLKKLALFRPFFLSLPL